MSATSAAAATAGVEVHAHVDKVALRSATEVLDSMGLTVEDAILILIDNIALEQRFPFEVPALSESMEAALAESVAEIEAGDSKTFNSLEELKADLHADD